LKLGLLLALLPSLAFGQQKTADSYRMDRLEILVNSLISGKPTTTSFVNMVGSITFLTAGAGIAWPDGTTSTSAFGSAGSGITQLTGDVTAGPGSGSKVATIAALAVTGAKMANTTITDTQVSAISESKITNLVSDLAAIGVSTTNIATSTRALQVELNAVGVSTGNIAASTTTLYGVKASTGLDNGLTRAMALVQVDSNLTLKSTLTVQGNAFSVGGSSFTVTGGSGTVAFQMAAGAFQAGNITGSAQCVQADTNGTLTGTGAACGSGSGGSGSLIVGFRQKNFLDQVNGSKKAFTLPEAASSSPTVILDGLLQSGTSDYTWDGAAIVTMTTAPASNSSSFFVLYTINTSTLAAAMLTTSSDTKSGSLILTSSVTVNAFSAYSTTFSLTGTIVNGWNTVAISSGAGVTAVQFTGLDRLGVNVSSITFRAHCDGTKHTSGVMQFRTGVDAGANYTYGGVDQDGTNSVSGCPGDATNQGAFHCLGVADGSAWSIVIHDFKLEMGSRSSWILHHDTVSHYSGHSTSEFTGRITYFGSTALSSVVLLNSAGNFDYRCTWEAFIPANGL
jgi:hypothetical protein